MIHLRFTTASFDRDANEWQKTVHAELFAEGDHDLRVEGPDAEWIDVDLAVIEPESGDRLTREDGAERWARALPTAFRSGHLAVEEVHEMSGEAEVEPASEGRHREPALLSAVHAVRDRLPF